MVVSEKTLVNLGFTKEEQWHNGASYENCNGWKVWFNDFIGDKGKTTGMWIKNINWPENRSIKYWSFEVRQISDITDCLDGIKTLPDNCVPTEILTTNYSSTEELDKDFLLKTNQGYKVSMYFFNTSGEVISASWERWD